MIGNAEHNGYISSWKLSNGFDINDSYYTTGFDNEIIDLPDIYQLENPGKRTKTLRFNACYFESPDVDMGILYMRKTPDGYIEASNFIIPVMAGTGINDIGMIFEAFKVIAPAGTRIRYVANYF